MNRNGVRYAGAIRWTLSLCLVLVLHMGASLAILRNLDTVSAPAAPPALVLIDLPVDAILPKAESVQSIAAEQVADVEPTEVVETSVVPPDDPMEKPPEVEEDRPPEQVDETPPEMVETVKPPEESEAPLAVAEPVTPTEAVTAKPVEKPMPKPKKKPQVVKQKASNASNNSVASSGAGRSNPKALARYLSQVRAKILRHRRSVSARARGRVTIRATIMRSGALSGVGISRSSGSASLDRAALSIVSRVGSVSPIPADVGRSSISLSIPFTFAGR